MVFTYTFEDNFFYNLFENDLEIGLEKTNNIIDAINKNSILVDCSDEQRFNNLACEVKEIHKNLLSEADDEILKKELEVLWFDKIEKNHFYIKNRNCDCDEHSCNLDKNINEIKKYISNFPSFVLTTADISEYSFINIFNYRTNGYYKENFIKTCYESELELSFEIGKNIIKKMWHPIINLCTHEIIILDTILFEKWDDNYLNGLKQFAEVIAEINSNIKLKIITRKGEHKSIHSHHAYSQHEIKEQILESIKSIDNVKVEILLCDRSAKLDHDRFIMFDDKIALEINKGVDTFYSKNNSISNYRIIYYYTHEVQKYFSDPLRNLITDTDFTNIKNY
ncbi:MAG: hypothetical protein IPM32_08840 [Ignavibacteriae bacterium]|nr:hypothetical protein [Ignavibacteriota bacterium]